MARISVRKEIEIERNVIEQYLMDAKEFIRGRRKAVLYTLAGICAVAVIGIAFAVYVDTVSAKNQLRFDRIMENFKKSYPNDRDGLRKTADEMKKFIDSTNFGVSRQMGMFVLGSIYFSEKNHAGAARYMLNFSDKTSSPFFAALALLKAAVSYEELNDLDGAMKIYEKLENGYSGNPVEDQVFYGMARVFQKKGDLISARNYLNKVIATYPNSVFAEKSRKRLFVLKNKS